MSRHRGVRALYNEYAIDDDEYGHSVDDDAPISPTDAQQWLFDRERGQQSMSSFIANHRDIEEEDEEQCESQDSHRRNSESFEMPPLSDEDRAKLQSCIEEIRNVIGDAPVSERQLVETVLKHNFDFTKSLDDVLIDMSQKQEPLVKKNEKKESIEKDLCCTNTEIAKLNIETEQFPPQSFNKLAEFANFHLTNRPVEATSVQAAKPMFNIPKFSIKNPSTKPAFIIPQLSQTSKLDDLKNRIGTPHELSMQKIMALKDLKISNITKPNESTSSNHQIIDLSTALRTGNSPILVPNRIPTDENFQPKFIDCEILTNYLPTITKDCEIDASHVLVRKITKFRTKCNSKFGKIICSKFRNRNVPYVDHNFNQKYTIDAFPFLSPSPCDVILKHVRLNVQR